MKLAILLQMSISLLVVVRLFASDVWAANLAYVDLSRVILEKDAGRVSGFETWASSEHHSIRARDAATYGMAMLLAHRSRVLSEDWLEKWSRDYRRLTTDSLRSELIVYELVGSLTPKEILTIVNRLGAVAAAHWLTSAAIRRPEEASIFVGVIEHEGLVSVLSTGDQGELASVYGNLADQLRQSGGSTEEVMVLVNKSLALNPQSETAMIVEALMLNRSGQLQAGLALLEEVTILHPDSSFGWAGLASLRLADSDFRGAENAARRAVCCQGGWGESLLATVLLKQERCSEALPYAQSSLSDHPDAPNYLLVLGDVHWCLGDREQASQVYRRLETVAPDWVQDRAPYVHERMGSTR